MHFFQDSFKKESLKEHNLFEIEIFCKITNVLTTYLINLMHPCLVKLLMCVNVS